MGTMTSGKIPTLMDGYANDGAEISNAIRQNALEASYHRKFFQSGKKLKGLSATLYDFEGSPFLPQYQEATALKTLEINEGYSIRHTTSHYGAGYRLSIITAEAGREELINAGPQLLGRAEADTREYMTHALVVFGDTAPSALPKVGGVPMANTLTGDGLTLFNNAHRFRQSSLITNSNVMASYYHPTQTGVNQVNKMIRRWRDPWGKPLKAKVDSLMVPVELALLVDVFMASDKDPLSGNNAANQFSKLVPGGAFVNELLPSTGTWYALTNIKDQRPQLREMFKPKILPVGYDDNTMTSGVNLLVSYSVGNSVHGWMSMVSVPGTSTTVTNSLL